MSRILISTLISLCLSLTAMAGVTDISTLSNAIYAEPVTTGAGTQITLSVKMKNAVPTTGFQVDLVLPQGVTVPTDEDGYYDIYLSTERTTSRKTDYFSSALQSDGSIRIMANSTRSNTIEGTDGEVCTIQLQIAPDLANGSYPISFKNIVLTDANSQTTKVALIETALNIGRDPYDLNGDGKVDVQDVTFLVNHILTLDSCMGK